MPISVIVKTLEYHGENFMKNIITIAFLILLLSVPAFSQIATKGIEVKYDKFKDKTTVTLMLEVSVKLVPKEDLVFGSASAFDGKKPTSIPDKHVFTFISNSKLKQYEFYNSLIILADDERIKLGNATSYIPGKSDFEPSEIMIYTLTSENLKKIVGAKKVEMQLGKTEFTLTEPQLEAIKEFYKQIIP